LVLLHGYGADELDLVPLAAELDPALPVVSLQGPLSLGGGMRAWFNLQQTARDGFRIDPGEVLASDALVASALDELAQARGPLLLLGFSQGACMAIRATLTRPENVRALISLSGVPPAAAPLQPAPAESLRGLPAFAAHGGNDLLLPIEAGRLVRDELQRAGFALEYHEYPMGHMIAPAEVLDLRRWLHALPR
jgi:phospholipase/carboxylesterase